MLQGVRQGEVGKTGTDPARMRLCTDIGNSAPVRDMGVQPPLSEVPAFIHHYHRASCIQTSPPGRKTLGRCWRGTQAHWGQARTAAPDGGNPPPSGSLPRGRKCWGAKFTSIPQSQAPGSRMAAPPPHSELTCSRHKSPPATV